MKTLLGTGLAIVIIAVGSYFYFSQPKGIDGCTQEAKFCADGSAVSRFGPQCNFANCPEGRLEGVVREVSVSAKVILILARDDQLYNLAADSNTTIKNSEGVSADFSSITIGDFIRVTGKAGEDNNIIPKEIELANE